MSGSASLDRGFVEVEDEATKEGKEIMPSNIYMKTALVVFQSGQGGKVICPLAVIVFRACIAPREANLLWALFHL